MRSLLLVFVALSASAQPRNGPIMYWPFVSDETTTSNLAMSASATWLAVGFQATASRTLSELHLGIASVTGTLGTGDLRLALYSDSAGKPGTEIEGINSSGAPSATWQTITGFASSTTAGTTYWIVARNMNGTAASNYFTISRRAGSVSNLGISNSAQSGTQGGWMGASSTDSGANWTRSATATPIAAVWSDGTAEGFPISAAGTSCQVYAARECGLLLRTGATALRVAGVAAQISKTGTPTGGAWFRLYEGTGNSRTLVATTGSTTNASTSVSYTQLWFSSSIVLKAWTSYTLVLSETAQSDASTSRYNLVGLAFPSSLASLFSASLGAATQYSATTDGGATWTDTANQIHHIAFVLDPRSPFLVPSGGFAITQ